MASYPNEEKTVQREEFATKVPEKKLAPPPTDPTIKYANTYSFSLCIVFRNNYEI